MDSVHSELPAPPCFHAHQGMETPGSPRGSSIIRVGLGAWDLDMSDCLAQPGEGSLR
jgi:hypothetical protein